MKKSLQKNTYKQLVEDITELYDGARHALVEAYWQIGKRIVEQEQQGDDTPEYGVRLLARLSEDLQHKPGSGFSVRNLRKMRRFYLNNRNRPAPADLTWTQHVELLPVTNKADKRRLERRIISDNLSIRDLHDNGSRDIGFGLFDLVLAGGESLFLQELAELVVYSLDMINQPVE